MKTRSRPRQKSEADAGFSIVELLIVMIIMIVIMGVLGSVVGGMESSYIQQRPRTEAINNANAAMDAMVRLIRMSGNNLSGTGINPGSTGDDGLYHTIQIQSDWNPKDGATSGVFEDVTFSVSNGALQVKEGTSAATVYVNSIGSVTFTHYDNTNVLITDPVGNNNKIALVKIDLTTTGSSPMTFTSMVNVRKN